MREHIYPPYHGRQMGTLDYNQPPTIFVDNGVSEKVKEYYKKHPEELVGRWISWQLKGGKL